LEESHIGAALRKVQEETGIELQKDGIEYLVRRTIESPTGQCHRVIQHYYLCRQPIQLSQLPPSDKVAGIVEVDLDDFSLLLHRRRDRINALVRMFGSNNDIQSTFLTQRRIAYPEVMLDGFRQATVEIRQRLTT
jgi:8-oxo-dGTP pyrophosphatase MutT (NUDIX family)